MKKEDLLEYFEHDLQEYPDLLSVPQICHILSLSKQGVYRLLSSGELPSIKIIQRYRIPKSMFIKYLASLEHNIGDEFRLQKVSTTEGKKL